MPSSILVTGGAGYIGSHTVRQLGEAGDPPVLIAGAQKIRDVLGWVPRYDDLEGIARSSLDWEHKLAERGQ